MGIFDRFRKRGGKAKGEPTPPSAPTPAPTPQAPAGQVPQEPKKRGLLGRMADKVRRKKPPEAPPEAPPAAPPAPPSPPEGPPAPPTPAEGPEPEGEGVGEGEEPEEKDYSDAPSSMTVAIPGTWQFSKKKWVGIVRGTLSGARVVQFLQHLDNDEEEDAVMMICEEFDQGSGFASAVDLPHSTWSTPSF